MSKLIKNKSHKKTFKTTAVGRVKKKAISRIKDKNGKKISKKVKLEKTTNGHGDLDDSNHSIKRKPSRGELKSVIKALEKDPGLLVVRKALKYIPHYLKSEGLTKKLLKEIIKLWAEAGEKVRIVCLLCLIRIYTKLQDKERKQLVIKKLYSSFLEKCRITKLETMSMIGFMRHSLIELYKLDPQIALKQVQSSCQQLTLTLKNALTHRNEESYRTVLNWQFANCLILLSSFISTQDDDKHITSLTHQVIQLNLGAIGLLTSPRYYPYYCHLLENLINLSSAKRLFIPILPTILSILDRLQLPKKTQTMDDKAKKGGVDEDEDAEDDLEKKESVKEYNMDLLNHVSLEEAHSPQYNIAVLDKIYELILKYLASQCHKIAFPELVLFPCVQLKKWIKKNHGQHSQKFQVLLEKVKSDSERLVEARKSASFAFTDYAAVDAWEKKMKDSNKQSLARFVEKLDA